MYNAWWNNDCITHFVTLNKIWMLSYIKSKWADKLSIGTGNIKKPPESSTEMYNNRILFNIKLKKNALNTFKSQSFIGSFVIGELTLISPLATRVKQPLNERREKTIIYCIIGYGRRQWIVKPRDLSSIVKCWRSRLSFFIPLSGSDQR